MMNLKIGVLSMMVNEKIHFEGEVIGVQPRIRLLRSFDQRSHSYLGYVLGIRGQISEERKDFTVGIGKALQTKHRIAVGFRVGGECLPAAHARTEPAEADPPSGWHGVRGMERVDGIGGFFFREQPESGIRPPDAARPPKITDR